MTKVTRTAQNADESTLSQLREHPLWTASPSQIRTWVDNNVNDLASAKNVLGWLAVLVIYSVRKRLG